MEGGEGGGVRYTDWKGGGGEKRGFAVCCSPQRGIPNGAQVINYGEEGVIRGKRGRRVVHMLSNACDAFTQ